MTKVQNRSSQYK